MRNAQGAAIPTWGKLTLGLTILNSWVLFEETIVDRTGLSRYMPFYRVGRFCAWDAGAMILVVLGLTIGLRWLAARPSRNRPV